MRLFQFNLYTGVKIGPPLDISHKINLQIYNLYPCTYSVIDCMWSLYLYLYLLVCHYLLIIPVYLIALFVKLFRDHYYFNHIVDRSPPTLQCPEFLEKTISTTTGIKVDLNESVTTGATFYPNQFITLNPSTLDGPRQVNGTLQDKWGTSNTCTFLIYTKGKDFAQYYLLISFTF